MVYAKKSYGQHFLKNDGVCQAIVAAAQINPDELIVEVGPGRGALTKFLAAATKNLVLIETDQEMIDSLAEFAVQIIKADAAKFDFCRLSSLPNLPATSYKLIGNLPYNAGTAIVMNALTSKCPPTRLVVMLQKEVANKMLAKPGEMNLLSVATQLYAKVSRVIDVKPGSFSPPPKVDSTVICLDVLPTCLPAGRQAAPETIIALAKIAFNSPRKQLHRTLADSGIKSSETIKGILSDLGLPPTARPQELSIEQWAELQQMLK
jgi:16S rRNA (adenine1518-N6/adenine1519-N6)-dimethyltransferase